MKQIFIAILFVGLAISTTNTGTGQLLTLDQVLPAGLNSVLGTSQEIAFKKSASAKKFGGSFTLSNIKVTSFKQTTQPATGEVTSTANQVKFNGGAISGSVSFDWTSTSYFVFKTQGTGTADFSTSSIELTNNYGAKDDMFFITVADLTIAYNELSNVQFTGKSSKINKKLETTAFSQVQDMFTTCATSWLKDQVNQFWVAQQAKAPATRDVTVFGTKLTYDTGFETFTVDKDGFLMWEQGDFEESDVPAPKVHKFNEGDGTQQSVVNSFFFQGLAEKAIEAKAFEYNFKSADWKKSFLFDFVYGDLTQVISGPTYPDEKEIAVYCNITTKEDVSLKFCTKNQKIYASINFICYWYNPDASEDLFSTAISVTNNLGLTPKLVKGEGLQLMTDETIVVNIDSVSVSDPKYTLLPLAQPILQRFVQDAASNAISVALFDSPLDIGINPTAEDFVIDTDQELFFTNKKSEHPKTFLK